MGLKNDHFPCRKRGCYLTCISFLLFHFAWDHMQLVTTLYPDLCFSTIAFWVCCSHKHRFSPHICLLIWPKDLTWLLDMITTYADKGSCWLFRNRARHSCPTPHRHEDRKWRTIDFWRSLSALHDKIKAKRSNENCHIYLHLLSSEHMIAIADLLLR